ncbi:RhuM family protein [Amedibacillus sp. YH-ame10]
MEEKLELIKFNNGELEIIAKLDANSEEIWITRNQMAELFDRDVKTIGKHINNALKEELKGLATIAKIATVQNEGSRNVKRNIEYYNLEVVNSVGYRVKSNQGILFRKWANHVLKEFSTRGYVINTSKFNLPDLEKISNLLDDARKISGDLQLTSNDMLDFLLSYNKGLKILDDYDHQVLEEIKGVNSTYVITYEECKGVIENTMFADKGDLFGIEKDNSFKSAIATIYQSFDGVELYPTLEDKAAHLLYFITKNHAYADGNKRIAATIFLYFLEKNHALHRQNKLRISNTTLATLTILVASSNPNDKESIINLIKIIISIE